MSQFSELYGDDLDRELGSADRTKLFTTARRKRAINQGQLKFVQKTECLVYEEAETLTDEQAEYDLNSVIASTAFMRFAGRQPYIRKEDANGNYTYLMGDDFTYVEIAELDRSDPGWRNASAGTPFRWYVRTASGGVKNIGLYPAPDIPSGETWILYIPYVVKPTALSADGDIPFDGEDSLEPYHQALVHYAAGELEKFRRNYQVSGAQFEAFQTYVDDFFGEMVPSGGEGVSFARNYFSEAQTRPARPPDPRR